MEKIHRTWLWLVLVGFVACGWASGCSSSKSASPGGMGGTANGMIGAGGAGGGVPDAGIDNASPTDAPVDVVATTPVKLVFGPPTLTMTEGQAMPGVLTVSLDREWSTDITVSIISSNPNVAIVVEGSVTFPAMTMAQKQIHILAPVDDDTVPDMTTIIASAAETGAQAVTVSVDDPDIQSLLAYPPRVSLTEGRTESLTVRLAKKPSSAVVITLASSNAAKLALDVTSLTFDPTNYSIPQSITLTGVKDDDALSEHVSVSITATGSIESLSVPVEITDIDAVNLDITPSSVALVERANMPGTVMVSLTKAPPNDMNVMVASSDGSKVTVSPPLLAFNAANYGLPQAVTVTAVPDNDGKDETAKVTFTATGITPAPDPRDVTVTVKDNDSQSVTAIPAMLTLGEGAMTTFTVQLTLVPDGDTTVNIFSQNPDEVTVITSTLHFNASNYNVPQTVTIQADQDDDLADGNVDITLISSSGAMSTVNAHIIDDDHQAIMLVPAGGGSSLTMQEGASSALGVRLAFRPANGDTVTFAAATMGGGPDKLSVAPTQVIFAGPDYATPKFVTLSALHLPDLADVPATVTASSGSAPAVTLPVKILDIDIQNLSVIPDAISLTEGGAPTTFMVALTQQPPSAVTPTFMLSANLINGDPSKNKVIVDSSACASLVGAAAMTGCAVSVSAYHDDDTRNESGTITITALTVDDNMKPLMLTRTVAVNVTDVDTQGVSTVPTTLGTVMEGGSTTFGVRLKANPVTPVTVSVVSGDPAHFSVDPPTLTFSASDYADPTTAGHQVTVKSLDDNDMKSYNTTITVQGAAAGATDPASQTLAIAETNTDTQSIVLGPTSFTMQEGSNAQIGVRLAYRPVGPTLVTLDSSQHDKFRIAGADSTPVTFEDGTAPYSTPQFVPLSSVRDFIIDNPATGQYPVTLTASSTGIASSMAVANIVDVDVLNFTVSGGPSITVMEGTSTTFTVGLTASPSSPAAPVAVNVSSTIPVSSLTVTPTTCALARLNDTCTITVTAVTDDNAIGESGTILIRDTSGQIATNLTLNVATLDANTQGLSVTSPGSPTIHEKATGGTNKTTFAVKFLQQPANALTTVTISSTPAALDGIFIYPTAMETACSSGSPPAGCASNSTTLTFSSDKTSPNGWSTAQMVTIKGAPDCDLRVDPFSVQVHAQMVLPDLPVADQFVNVSEIDDDTQQIIVSAAPCAMPTTAVDCNGTGGDLGSPGSPAVMLSQSLTEGSTTTPLQFCVSLKYQPISTNFVDVGFSSASAAFSSDSLMLNAPPGKSTPLMFQTADYYLPQLLSVTAQDDHSDYVATANISSSGFLATRQVNFNVQTPNRQAFVFMTPSGTPITSLVVPATGPTSINVGLLFRPRASVNVSCVVDNASLATIDPKTFTLSTANWSTGQAISVMANGFTTATTITCQATDNESPVRTTSLTISPM